MSKKVDKVDDFIGRTFPTPKGGVLTVVSWNNMRDTQAVVTCSLCSLDKELYPGKFKIFLRDLEKGKVPCGCTGKPRRTEYQYKVKVLRKCEERGYAFFGWSGNFERGKTKLKLFNAVTGNRWSTTDIDNFLRGRGDPAEQILNIKKIRYIPDMVYIDRFLKAGFSVEDKFTRNLYKKDKSGGYSYWEFECHLCSKDEYVSAGLCSGIFEVNLKSLTGGSKPCRCNKYNYPWTKEQREYQIKKICAGEGLEFISWAEVGYIGCDSKFKWKCARGHLCENTRISNFIAGNRCKSCVSLEESCNGFYPERVGEKDYLYLMDFMVSTKVGRSFNIPRRQDELRRVSGLLLKPRILQTLTATHQIVFDIEQEIHKKLRNEGFQYYCDWTNECFTKDCCDYLQELLEGYVRSGILTVV